MPQLHLQPHSSLPPVRGLLLGRTGSGTSVELTTVRQWMRLNVEKFKAQKIDLWEPVATMERVLPLLEEARHLGVHLSLRTTIATDPALLRPLHDAGLFDVLLRIDLLDEGHLATWTAACAELKLPLRVELHGALLTDERTSGIDDLLSEAAVAWLYLSDPIAPTHTSPAPPYPPTCLQRMRDFAETLQTKGTEVHLMDVPFCQATESLWGCISNTPQRLLHHQGYHPEAEAFARKMAPLSPNRIQQAVEVTLGQGASVHNLIDRAVLPWILEKPRWFFWLWFLHKLTRRLPLRRGKAAPLPEDIAFCEHMLADYRAKQRRRMGPICAECRLHPICDHHTDTFRRAFPQLPVKAIPGAPCHDPLAFRSAQTGWFDAVDAERRSLPERLAQLSEEAARIIAEQPPTREIPAESYDIEDHTTHHMPASVRWFSFSTAELQSTVLARLTPPFTIAFTVGGGIAERVGFGFGRHARIVCPMTAYSHRIALHVDAQGHYVLLRDNLPVLPAALAHTDAVPERLGGITEPRIAITNIDGQTVTQTVLLWEDRGTAAAKPAPARHSVIIVCTRFARRLQAVLLALAHQGPVDDLEVIVGFVPGVDATDDVLDSVRAAHPALRLVRVPFAADKTRAKGFLINECVALSSGAWVTLLDADIVLPPDYFEQLDALPDTTVFAAPDGRYMLSAETTARILLGDIRPWDDYATLQHGAPEYRHRESEGVPAGFCQSVRRTVFESINYAELDHFEGSDWWFSKRVTDTFGPETRLEDLRVLHLDHGGSQWYGTGKQR